MSKNHTDTNRIDHIEQLCRGADEFSHSIERQKQIDELVRDSLASGIGRSGCVMGRSITRDNKLPKNHTDISWHYHVKQLYRIAGEFSNGVERQIQIEELVRVGLDRNTATAVVDL